jgi:spore germination protein GerM
MLNFTLKSELTLIELKKLKLKTLKEITKNSSAENSPELKEKKELPKNSKLPDNKLENIAHILYFLKKFEIAR